MTGIQSLKMAAAAALCFALPMAAGAATVSVTTDLPTVAIEITATPTTGSTSAPTPAGTPAYFANVKGDQFTGNTRVARDVWEKTALAGEGFYSSVSSNSFATFSFDKLQRGFSLVWGSPDDYNDLVLKLISNNSVVHEINGDDLIPPATRAVGAALLTVTGVEFDSLTFSSGKNAFEFANLETTPVPLPAAGWMLIAGLGALGAVARKRKAVAA